MSAEQKNKGTRPVYILHAFIMKTGWDVCTNIQIGKENKTSSPEINPTISKNLMEDGGGFLHFLKQ